MSMTDEEKRAIIYWKGDISLYHNNTQLCSEHYAQIILNLIEKQEKEIEELKEKNRYIKAQIPRDRIFYFSEADYVSKDEIRKRMEQTKKVYDEEIKPYMIEVGNGEKVLNVTGLNKKEKVELINKRNCLLVQIKTYEMLLED